MIPADTKHPPSDDYLDEPLNGAREIAKAIKRTLPQTFYGLERGYYDATKRGRIWQSTRRRLLGPPPRAEVTNTADSQAQAGAAQQAATPSMSASDRRKVAPDVASTTPDAMPAPVPMLPPPSQGRPHDEQ
jgi:hypothetical protein